MKKNKTFMIILLFVVMIITIGCKKSKNDAANSTGDNGTTTPTFKNWFSVSDTTHVYFAKGNLQFAFANNNWQFAENPWDYMGENQNASRRDLLSWDDYSIYLSHHIWRLLSHDEWRYLLNQRETRFGIRYAKAKIGSKNGIIVFPDDWDEDVYSVNNPNSMSNGSYNDNVITTREWYNTFDANGATFMPAAGSGSLLTYGGAYYHVNGNSGYYWTSTPVGEEKNVAAWSLHFFSNTIGLGYVSGDINEELLSVRLVRDADK